MAKARVVMQRDQCPLIWGRHFAKRSLYPAISNSYDHPNDAHQQSRHKNEVTLHEFCWNMASSESPCILLQHAGRDTAKDSSARHLSKKVTKMPSKWPKRVAALAIAAATTTALVPPTAEAAPRQGTVMAPTQRMTDATYESTQVGTHPKGKKINLTCYKRGQYAIGYYPGRSNLWYLVDDGYYVADIDISTGTNDPVTAACPATAKIDTNRYYTITSRNSGKLVDVRNASTTNGTAIQQYQANGSRAQSFKFLPTGGGFYRMVSELSGSQVWDAAGGRKTNGTKVHTWNWVGLGAANQQWMPVATGNYVTFKPRHAFQNMCLDAPNASRSNGVQLQLYTCNGTAAQQWTLKAKPIPLLSISQFANKYNGKTAVSSIRGDLPGECTSFVTRYLQEVYGVTVSGWGHAYSWAPGGKQGDSAGLAAKGFRWHNGATDSRDGDILVWKQYWSPNWRVGATGHIGIKYKGKVFDQNTNVKGRPYDKASDTWGVGYVDFDKGGYLGYWRRG